ncbi:unnamed protein product [Cochlearia groenlandica]
MIAPGLECYADSQPVLARGAVSVECLGFSRRVDNNLRRAIQARVVLFPSLCDRVIRSRDVWNELGVGDPRVDEHSSNETMTGIVFTISVGASETRIDDLVIGYLLFDNLVGELRGVVNGYRVASFVEDPLIGLTTCGKMVRF